MGACPQVRRNAEVEVDDVGPSLRNASAKVSKAARTSGVAAGGATLTRGTGDDLWAAQGTSDEPPF